MTTNNPHELLLQSQLYLSLSRNFENAGYTASAQIARDIAARFLALYEKSKIANASQLKGGN